MPYSFDSRVRYSEVGEDRKLTLPSMIDYFQDCSTFQSEDLGIGLECMEQRNRAWFIGYWQIELNRMPVLGEKIKIQTKPYDMRGFFGKRNFWLEDQEGEILAQADSLWIFLDTTTGKPARTDDDITERYGLEEPLPMEAMPRKVRMPKECVRQEEIQVLKAHLDTNHHVNNAQYLYMAQSYLPEGIEIGRVRVEYRKAAVLGDRIIPMVNRNNDIITIGLCDEKEEPYAVLEFQIRS